MVVISDLKLVSLQEFGCKLALVKSTLQVTLGQKMFNKAGSKKKRRLAGGDSKIVLVASQYKFHMNL